MLITSNTVPWLLGLALGRHLAAPLDCGLRLRDGEPLFGAHKTWRGLAGALAATGIAAGLVGAAPVIGIAFGTLAMAGDLLSSWAKRRLHLQSGHDVPGLDQLPECVLPLAVLAHPLGLELATIVVAATLFTLGHLAIARLRRAPG